MKNTITALVAGAALISSGHAAVIGINFGSERQSGVTDNYTTAGGTLVSSWNYEATGDWSGAGTTFGADGASVGIWHDAKNTWESNAAPATTSALFGYLDDGINGENYIHITGLTGWLAATGDTHYKVTVLRASDNAIGFTEIEIITGDVTGESGWLGNGNPSGGTVVTGDTFLASGVLGAAGAYTYETEAYTANADGFAMHYETTADGITPDHRASISGIVIESYAVPEPSSAALLGLGGLAMILRRRK